MAIWDCYNLGPDCIINNHRICIAEIRYIWRKTMVLLIRDNPGISSSEIINSGEFFLMNSWLVLDLLDELRIKGRIE